MTETKLTLISKAKLAISFFLSGIFGAKSLRYFYWNFKKNQDALNAAIAAAPDAIHAHDWDALPIAAEAAKKLNIPYVYDSHEFATQMHQERFLWRVSMSKTINLLEMHYIRNATKVITVSDGISNALVKQYDLKQNPTVVRNIPELGELDNTHKFDPKNIILHYHGILANGRGIGKILEAAAKLPENYTLQLVGPERQKNYLSKLWAKAETLQVSKRLKILNPVSPDKLVALASQADFGFCILQNNTLHNKFALPNKIFEYIHAGLFIVASNGPDIESALRKAGSTFITGDFTADELANKIKNISPNQLSKTRTAYHAAREHLNWRVEKKKLSKLYEEIFARE